MRSVDPSIRVAIREVLDAPVRILKAGSPRAERKIGVCRALRRPSAVFDVENSDLSISGCGDKCGVVRMGHELDGENICGMAGCNGGFQSKRCHGVLTLIGMDIEMLIIAAGGKQPA